MSALTRPAMTERSRKQLEDIRALGPPPKMWRYRQLRDWLSRFNAIIAIDTSEMAEMLRSVYSHEEIEALVSRPSPFFSTMRKAPR